MNRPILITGAMNPEIECLVNKLENVKKEKISIYNIYKGNIKDYPVIILQTDVGTINAAISTTLVLEKYNPILIINEGIAGGIGRDVHKADLVIGTQCFNTISAKTPYKEEGEGSNSLEWDYITFVNGGKDEKKTIKSDEKLVDFVYNMSEKYTKGKTHKGIIGSSDIWNCEKDRIMYLNNKHNVICAEMEGISVYTVAKNYNIPVIGVRTISDNEILNEEYDRNLGIDCQEFVYEVVKGLIEEDYI